MYFCFVSHLPALSSPTQPVPVFVAGFAGGKCCFIQSVPLEVASTVCFVSPHIYTVPAAMFCSSQSVTV